MTPPARNHGCTAPDLEERGSLSLPVVATEHGPSGPIRRSRSGRKRAVVLAIVQLLIFAHVALWLLSREFGWWGGRTTTPIEPSEAMEFVKDGVVNAGLLFFGLALLSTLILGRWFCGWGCHVVMLQDLCSWLMKKMGVRPKPFRSRLLVYVPLVLALYMFVWPAFYRLAIAPWIRPDLEWQGFSLHLTSAEFYRTFPGVLVAIPFLFICGFAAVYFLGAKGFCTYGCPYGGFFAPLDEFAVGRIRVTDACNQCGHCTAVCTSNVRVHEEVREYGMVVDPGCMKCLDCVSVCPNDALYFGFGRPAQWKGPAAQSKPKRKYDFTWGEEIGFTVLFLLVFMGVRGVYNVVPMLMAAGVAGVVTFLAWKWWRVVRDPHVRFHQFQLKQAGRVRRSGVVFAVIAAAALLLSAHSGIVNAQEAVGRWHAKKITVPVGQMLDPSPSPLPPDQERAADRAIRYFRRASSMFDGGIGLANKVQIDSSLAWMHCYKGDFAEAERLLRRVVEVAKSEGIARDLASLIQEQSKDREALVFCERVLDENPQYARFFEETMFWCHRRGLIDEAADLCRRRLEHLPDDPATRRWLALFESHGEDG